MNADWYLSSTPEILRGIRSICVQSALRQTLQIKKDTRESTIKFTGIKEEIAYEILHEIFIMNKTCSKMMVNETMIKYSTNFQIEI